MRNQSAFRTPLATSLLLSMVAALIAPEDLSICDMRREAKGTVQSSMCTIQRISSETT